MRKAGIELPTAMRDALRDYRDVANARPAFRAVQANGKRMKKPSMDFQALHARIHSLRFRRTFAEKGPCHFLDRLQEAV